MKNWTIKEAVEAINKNDATAIKEISKHFPMFFLAIARNDLQALAAMMPEKFTVRRLQMTDAAVDDADEGAEPQTDADAEDASEDAGEADLSSMSAKELMKLCDKRGIKVPHYGKNKQFYLDALQGTSGNDEDSAEDNGEDNGDAESGDEYEGKSAMELYKLCKKRGIKAAAKKPAKFYADALRKADAEAADAGNDDADGWDDDAEDDVPEEKQEKKAPAKGGKAASGKKSGKPAPAKAEEEDDGDDWDI